MKTITKNLYSFDELTKENKEKVIEIERRKRASSDYLPLMEEICDSFKAVFRYSCITLKDWEIGLYRSNCRVQFQNEETENLSGRRALAWLENNLLGKFRTTRNTKNSLKYREHLGSVKDCPFTGTCFDHDFLDSLVKDIRSGETLRTAYEGLASVAQNLIENENDHYMSDESIVEDLQERGDVFEQGGN